MASHTQTQEQEQKQSPIAPRAEIEVQLYAYAEGSLTPEEEATLHMTLHADAHLQQQLQLIQQENADTEEAMQWLQHHPPLPPVAQSLGQFKQKHRSHKRAQGRQWPLFAGLLTASVCTLLLLTSQTALFFNTGHHTKTTPGHQRTPSMLRRKGPPTQARESLLLSAGLLSADQRRIVKRLQNRATLQTTSVLALSYTLQKPGGYAYLFWDRTKERLQLLAPSRLEQAMHRAGNKVFVLGQGSRALGLPLKGQDPGPVRLILLQTKRPLRKAQLKELQKQRQTQIQYNPKLFRTHLGKQTIATTSLVFTLESAQ